MANSERSKERLSIDVPPEEHRRIKIHAARHGVSIRLYVLESVRQRLSQEDEAKELSSMTTHTGRLLKEVWDNDKDAAYDQL